MDRRRKYGQTDGLGHYNISLTFFNPENNQNQYRKLVYRNLVTFVLWGSGYPESTRRLEVERVFRQSLRVLMQKHSTYIKRSKTEFVLELNWATKAYEQM